MSGDFRASFLGLLEELWRPRIREWGDPDLTPTLERPAARAHGDLATNFALIAAGAARRPSREIAAELANDVKSDSRAAALIDSVQVDGPGFINFFLSRSAWTEAVRAAMESGRDFGAGTAREEDREDILLEYVSANPTGQLHVGHARYAAYGDSLRRILVFAGHNVTTEFYVNDFGSQMDNFGKSLMARYAELLGQEMKFPEDGYKGNYPVHIAERILDEVGDRFADDVKAGASPATLEFFKLRGRDLVLEEMRNILAIFRVEFDGWYSEREKLQDSGAVMDVLAELGATGAAYRREGALWLDTCRYGDDKDRVLRRSSGEPTYFAADIAYHRDKLRRGYGRLIDIWGADHHGYVNRMRAAFELLKSLEAKPGPSGADGLASASSHMPSPQQLEIIIGQLVNVIEMGERKQMSKRAGTMVSLGELVEHIGAAGMDGVDAARFFLVDRGHDTTLDLDIEKAKQKSEDNPVYYVQYAHARICRIVEKAAEAGVGAPESIECGSLEDQEKDLILTLLDFPGTAARAAETRGPNRLTAYARELAAAFHAFYHHCPVIRADPATAGLRLSLCLLTRSVIARCLDLVGVTAPESM